MNLGTWTRRAVIVSCILTLTACATAQQQEAAFAPRYAGKYFPSADQIDFIPTLNERQTATANSRMVKEDVGPKQGARLLADISDESWAYSFTSAKGDTFSEMSSTTGNKAIFCTPRGIVYNSLSGHKGGCLVDNTGDGLFDEMARADSILDAFGGSGKDLATAVPYEIVPIDTPDYILEMNLYYRGIIDGQIVIDSAGARVKGEDIPETNLMRADKHRFPAGTTDREVNVDGIKLIIHEATESEIAYTVVGGRFEQLHFLDPLHHVIIRRNR